MDRFVLCTSSMKVIGYCRVSTDEQATSGISLEAQTAKVRAYCDLYDLELVDVVEDPGASARSLDRPGLQRVLAALDERRADGVVVAKLDRLTRNVADMASLISGYFGERAGRSLFSVGDSIDTRTAAGRMVLNILTSVAQWERETIAERTRDALRFKRQRGEVYSTPPLGYAAADGRLVEVAAELAIVDEIFRMRDAGLSLRAICARLEAQGAPTKHGGRWRPATLQRVLARGRVAA